MRFIKPVVYANLAGLALVAGAAQAETRLASSASGVGGQVNALGVVHAGVAVGAVSGATPGAYAQAGSVARVSDKVTLVDTIGLDVRQSFTTGLVTSAAFSGTDVATGTTRIDGLTSSLTTQLPLRTELAGLTISARTLGSTSVAGATADGVYGYGSSIIEGLRIGGSLLGALTIDGALYANAAPNTVVLRLAGLTVTLNEQIKTQLTSGDFGVTTNAVAIRFDNYLVSPVLLPRNPLTGSVLLGSSHAEIGGWVKPVLPPVGPVDPTGAVPEPAAWGLMILGFGLVGAALRRRPKGQAALPA